MLATAFQNITGFHLPLTQVERLALPLHIQHILSALWVDANQPIRVVFGYDGFSSEQTFRNKFADFLVEKTNIKGYGPASIPNLICCGRFSIFKTNGMPHFVQIPETADTWDFLATTDRNPLFLLLEILFCRLNFLKLVSYKIFGDDLTIEAAHKFISARAIKVNNEVGWEYFYQGDFGKSAVPIETFDQDWAPAFVDEFTWIILNFLCEMEQ